MTRPTCGQQAPVGWTRTVCTEPLGHPPPTRHRGRSGSGAVLEWPNPSRRRRIEPRSGPFARLALDAGLRPLTGWELVACAIAAVAVILAVAAVLGLPVATP